MGRMDFGNTAELIGQVTDVNQLQQMLKNPQYAGFTSVIIARLTEINRMQQAEAGAQPEAPTVAQQAMQGQVQPEQQAMAKGGIVAFRHGGAVRGFASGGKADDEWLYDREREYFGNTKREAAKAAEMIEKTKSPLLKPVVGLAGLTHIGLGGVADAVDPLARGLRYGVTATPYNESFDSAEPTAGVPVQPSVEPVAVQEAPKGLPALAPMSEQDLGLPSIGAGGYRSSSGGGKGPKTLTEYYNERKALYDAEKPKPKTKEELAREANMLRLRRQEQAWNAMGQSANKNPHLGILGHGIEGSAASTAFNEKQLADADAEAKAQAKMDQQDRKALLESSDREYGADARAARMTDAQYASSAAMLKEPAMREQAIRKRALDLANADRAKGIQRPLSDYHLQAWTEYNQGIQTQMLRGATATQNATQVGWNKYQSQNGPVPFERYQQMVSSGAITDGGDAGGQVLGTYPGTK
jgi:hypothetical protein